MEEVVIPPVPSDDKEEGKDLEKGFLKSEELPGFGLHEVKEVKAEHKIEEVHKKEIRADGRLPHDIVHKIVRATCLVALILWFVLIVLLSVITKSDVFNTFIGLAPVLLTIIITYILVDKYHLENGFLMIFPFIFTGVLFMLGIANLLGGIDYKTLCSVNIIFGLLFEAAIIIHYSFLRRERKTEIKETKEKREEKKLIIKLDDEEGLKTFVSNIEDKSKAINAVIGRVYSVKKGGSEYLRKKIKIDAAHYNEFNELKDEKPELRKATAIKLLNKIKERLELLQKPEKAVFDQDGLTGLLNLKKNEEGKDKVIDVLVNNDKDPVKAYYEGAMNFCEDALKELGKK